MTSLQQSACSVDLLADCKSVSSNSEWDYNERPLTQVPLKRSLDQGREEYKAAAHGAYPCHDTCRGTLSDAPPPLRGWVSSHAASPSAEICHRCNGDYLFGHVWNIHRCNGGYLFRHLRNILSGGCH